MTVSKDIILNDLPPFENNEFVIIGDQDIHDIVREVLEAHSFFAVDYDYIFQFFDEGSIKDICENLFDFCRQNIFYNIESEDWQTTTSPAALLALGKGDCKHYAGFIGGVLDAIKRNTGRKIDWCYVFAKYSIFDEDVRHVFIKVIDGNKEYWIDPVLKKFNQRVPCPVYMQCKKPKSMLTRISGIGAIVPVMVPLRADLQSNAVTKTISLPVPDTTELYPTDSITNIPQAIIDDMQTLLYYGIIDSQNRLNIDNYGKAIAGMSQTDIANLDSQIIEFYNFYKSYNNTISGASIGDFWDSLLKGLGTVFTSLSGQPVQATSGLTTDQLLAILNAQKAATPAPSITTYLPYILIGGVVLIYFMNNRR